MRRRLVKAFTRRWLYPWHDGTARRKDPTYGKIDRDIQWLIDDRQPSTIAERAVWEITVQEARDRRRERR